MFVCFLLSLSISLSFFVSCLFARLVCLLMLDLNHFLVMFVVVGLFISFVYLFPCLLCHFFVMLFPFVVLSLSPYWLFISVADLFLIILLLFIVVVGFFCFSLSKF